MAKSKRVVIGSFMKSKDSTKPPYIKFRDGVSFAQGQCVSVENKAFQLSSVDRAHSEGKLTAEAVEQIKERVEKMPDFVIAELVMFKKE